MSIPESRTCSPGPTPRSVRTPNGKVVEMPADWELLPPGDATFTRRVKQATPTWTVQEKRGRRTFSQGVWAPSAVIARIRAEIEAERATPAYEAARRSQARRRERVQTNYQADFAAAVLEFLDFAPRYAELAADLAARVTALATPVGSGTVARTERIPLPRRAEAAVIAWMRHQTTAYDHMSVPRVKGARRDLRRQLAQRSRELLERYRRGQDTLADCPLRQALTQPARQETPPRPSAPRSSAYDDFFLED